MVACVDFKCCICWTATVVLALFVHIIKNINLLLCKRATLLIFLFKQLGNWFLNSSNPSLIWARLFCSDWMWICLFSSELITFFFVCFLGAWRVAAVDDVLTVAVSYKTEGDEVQEDDELSNNKGEWDKDNASLLPWLWLLLWMLVLLLLLLVALLLWGSCR